MIARNHALAAIAVSLLMALYAVLPDTDGLNRLFAQGGENPGKALRPTPSAVRITILFFNDLHGHLLPFKMKDKDGTVIDAGGIAGMASLVKKIRWENGKSGTRTLLLVAGDVLQGTPLSTVFRGKADMEVMNAMGVDAMTVGNHEFDFGLENFLELKKLAKFPVISSNILWKGSADLVNEPSASFSISGVTVTVIGATTTQLLTTTSPGIVEKVTVADSAESVLKEYEKASPKGPVILLSHSAFAEDMKIAEKCPGILAIIGGHDQILMDPRKEAHGVPVFQAFEHGKYLGRLDIAIDRKTRKASILSTRYYAITPSLSQDGAVAKIVSRYHSKLSATFKEVLGESLDFFDGERGRIRYEETNLGSFVADVMREYTGADIAFINAGSLRSSLHKGPVSIEDVFKVMPYANELMTVTLTGDQVMDALSRAVRGTRQDEDGGFLHVSGISFVIKDRKAEKAAVLPGKTPLDPSGSYTVAITDFLYSGGDGYAVFAGKPAVKTGLPLRELLVDAIRKKGTIKSPEPGRIVRAD